MPISLNGIGFSTWNNIGKQDKADAFRKEKEEVAAGKDSEGIKVEISANGKAQLQSSTANMISVSDNKVTISDSYRSGLKNVSDKFWVEEGGVVRASMKAEKGRKFLSGYDKQFRDNMNFWSRMTQDPTFLGRDYSPSDVRERLTNAGVKTGFFTVTMGDHSATQFLTQGKNAAAVYSKVQYDQQFEYITKRFGKNYEPGTKLDFAGKEYELGEDGKLDIPYGEDIYDFRGSTSDSTTTNTDEVDRELKELKEKKAHLEQELRTADESRKKELEQEIQQVEMELTQKDNDTYRRQNAMVL